jgi:CubicO group peptidase (beta-lactamase class C family)
VKRLLLVVAFLTPAPVHAADPAAIDRIVRDGLVAWEVPGAAVVVGHGVREYGKPAPVTPDTVFPLASCTKAFTTTLLAMLADDGLLTWDDPVRKHLPGFRLADPLADANVTLRDLLTHRTGVAPHDLLWYRAPWDQDEMVRRIGRVPLSKSFRSAFQYQTIMYVAAGKAAANQADADWHELVRKRITEPLGMKGVTFTSADALKAADRAAGHRKGKAGKFEPVEWYAITDPNPAGSVNATARDLVPWLQLHVNLGSYNGKRLVSETNLAETHAPQIVLPMTATERAIYPETTQMSYAMGWVVQDYRGHLLVSHGGVIDGFRAHVAFLPRDGIGIAVLNNLDKTNMSQPICFGIIDHLLGLSPRDWNAVFLADARRREAAAKAAAAEQEKVGRADVKPSLPLERYAGEYEDAAYGKCTVKLDGGKLVWEWGTFRCPLEHHEADVFRAPEGLPGPALIGFAVAADGTAPALKALDVVFRRVRE